MTFTPEQLTKAKTAKTAEELLTLAKESGIEMTADEAAKYFAELNKQGELNDSELASVAGGKGEPDETGKEKSRPTCNGFPMVNGDDSPICSEKANSGETCRSCNYYCTMTSPDCGYDGYCVK